MSDFTILTERDLDALVAERVLGFHVETLRPAWYRGGQTEVLGFYNVGEPLMVYSSDANACNAMMYRNGVDERDGLAPPLPSYSTDIAEAWRVVEFMRERLFSARHFFVEALRDEVGKRLNFTSKIDHSEVVMYVLPVDICKAALAWAERRTAK